MFQPAIDNWLKMRLLVRVEMNTTFNKQINKMYAPVSACLTRWQHTSRLVGVVGTKT